MKRDETVQLSKAIGIVLMVIGHSGFWPYENPFIYAFHMPLFFFLSGYCFKDANLSNPQEYIKRKIKGVYLALY